MFFVPLWITFDATTTCIIKRALMKNKSINQVSIINGEDGPTSVFIFGEAQKQSLKIRIRNAIYQSRRKRIEKRIAANPHTLAEVVQYAKDHYDLVEINPAATNWIERQKNLKASLIIPHINQPFHFLFVSIFCHIFIQLVTRSLIGKCQLTQVFPSPRPMCSSRAPLGCTVLSCSL